MFGNMVSVDLRAIQVSLEDTLNDNGFYVDWECEGEQQSNKGVIINGDDYGVTLCNFDLENKLLELYDVEYSFQKEWQEQIKAIFDAWYSFNKKNSLNG